MVVLSRAAVTLAGTRTDFENSMVTLALSPSRAIDVTLPMGTLASCTCAPLDRSPTSEKMALAVRWPADPELPQLASASATSRVQGMTIHRRERVIANSRRHGPTGPAALGA